MRLALQLAEKGLGHTSPNPSVGAVLVKDGEIVGQGYHKAAGRDHAEVVAIKDAGERTHGATLYVTLEPCCHQGRTGPCTSAIIKSGIHKVIYAVKDPNPVVNGKGARCLRSAGLEVRNGLLRDEARYLNDQYFGYIENKRPWVVLKMAQTLDGRIATRSGDSRWISCPESLKLAHRLRADADAVVVGMGTVREDNPALTVRLTKGKNPYRVILSESLNFPRNCQLLEDNSDFKTIVATTAKSADRFSRTKRSHGLIVWEVKLGRNGLPDPTDLIGKANDFGIRSILIEGGAALATSFLKAGLVDKYIAVVAPAIVGDGINSIGNLDMRKIADGIRFLRPSFRPVGRDMVFVGYPRWKG